MHKAEPVATRVHAHLSPLVPPGFRERTWGTDCSTSRHTNRLRGNHSVPKSDWIPLGDVSILRKENCLWRVSLHRCSVLRGHEWLSKTGDAHCSTESVCEPVCATEGTVVHLACWYRTTVVCMSTWWSLNTGKKVPQCQNLCGWNRGGDPTPHSLFCPPGCSPPLQWPVRCDHLSGQDRSHRNPLCQKSGAFPVMECCHTFHWNPHTKVPVTWMVQAEGCNPSLKTPHV